MKKKPDAVNAYEIRYYGTTQDLHDFYLLLRKELLPSEPVQVSAPDLFFGIVGSGHRGSHYGWELYRVDETMVLVEYADSWNGMSRRQREASGPEHTALSRLGVSFHPPNKELNAGLETILGKCRVEFIAYDSSQTRNPQVSRPEDLGKWRRLSKK